jgi:hypothetical protein
VEGFGRSAAANAISIYFCDKHIALAGNGVYVAGVFFVIPERTPNFGDRVLQAVFSHMNICPDAVEQFALRDRTPGIFNKVYQGVERPTGEVHTLIAAIESATGGIQGKFPKSY